MPNKKPKIKCICKNCGKPFEIYMAWAKKGEGVYCSRKCSLTKYPKKIKCICKTCGKEFYRTPSQVKNGVGKYCSKKCFTIDHNVKCVCKFCGKIFYRRTSEVKNGYGKYCSEKCKYNNMHGSGSHFWVDGRSFGAYCPKFNKEFKERVRAYFGHKCFMCGEKQNGTKLSVHHVDYDKKTCCNDDIPLFVPLCERHHNKTNHGDREAWSAYFRMGIYQHTNGTMKTFYSKEEYENIKIRIS